MKVVRLLLSAVVSIWLAGGCLLGCGSVIGAEQAGETHASVAGESCHAARSHDQAPQSPKKQIAGTVTPSTRMPWFAPAPRGMMKDCPLVVNATAATSKSSGHLPAPARGPVSVLPLIEKHPELSKTPFVVAFLPNRGPTYLRCCVFLI